MEKLIADLITLPALKRLPVGSLLFTETKIEGVTIASNPTASPKR
jgi:hypothetical protein